MALKIGNYHELHISNFFGADLDRFGYIRERLASCGTEVEL